MTLGTKDAGITSVSMLTGASKTAKTAVMPRGRKEPFFLAACPLDLPPYDTATKLTCE